MAIQLTVVRLPKGVTMAEMSKTFSEQGLTLGRGAGNTWVLQDPDRYLSTSHCALQASAGQFYIEDTSTNGTFLNGSDEPIGRGERVVINDGDSFEVGDYKFSVSIWAVEADTGVPSTAAPGEDTFGTVSPDPFGGGSADPFGGDNADPFSSGNSDPFGGSNADPFGQGADPFGGGGANAFDTPFPSSTDPLSDPLASSDPLDANDPFEQTTPGPFFSDPLAGPSDSGAFGADFSVQGGEQELDPLAALDKADGIMAPEPTGQSHFSGASQGQGANPMEDSLSWPSAASDGQIPDDWDDDFLSPSPSEPASAPLDPLVPPAQPAPVAKEVPRPKSASVFPDSIDDSGFHASIPLTDPPKVKVPAPERPLADQMPAGSAQAPIPQPTEHASQEKPQFEQPVVTPQRETPRSSVGQSNDDLSILFDAMGMDASKLSDDEKRDIHRQIGLTMRTSLRGMMQALRARATIKNEFRMNVTTIQPIENNPLKFSADVDEALENLFVKQSKAYKNALEAIEESFDGIAEHQVAIIAGIRAAFDAVLDRFDPEKLELQMSGHAKGVSLLKRQSSKNWSNYCDYYKELVDNMEQSFQYLFGEEFVQAYEEQLRRLAIARKTKNVDGRS